ncbi:YybH family protein [Rufibacter latericius]|uniref:Nuclear transport factor 2 family protein n=1 Tax=Rufibacter latericius TaxID=2487040 RepID=A0A3M9N044_9BACT|nr:nuclear transport factor 2 family protein [Rufibacter latericius]RNI31169.1 nuclear transport factor 2 family protein [Rufibacter latericius]
MENHTVIASIENPVEAAKKGLDGQVTAWNAGNLEEAMDFYWNSPEMLWISKNGVEKGWQPVLEMFQQDFKDRSTMGTYTYEPLHLETMGKEAALYVFRWKIELDGKRLMGSVSSQVWKKMNGKWVITSEHAS